MQQLKITELEGVNQKESGNASGALNPIDGIAKGNVNGSGSVTESENESAKGKRNGRVKKKGNVKGKRSGNVKEERRKKERVSVKRKENAGLPGKKRFARKETD